MADITMRQLLQAGAHFGHQTRYWSPSMAPYIFGDRNKIHIINLDKTLPMLKEAVNYLGSVAAQGGTILFVGTKRPAGKVVREQAMRCGSPCVDHRWLGGMLTNYKTVSNSITRLKDLEQRIESGATASLSKKESLSLERERAKLDRTLSGIKDMDGLPDVLFVIDVEHEYIAVAEANKLGIPVVAVVDSNCNLKGVDYVIPGNDDSTRAIRLYLEAAADAIIDARVAAAIHTPIPGDGEYIEVDGSGDVLASGAARARGAKQADGDATAESQKTDPVEEKPVVKKVVKKKVTRKIAAKKPVTRKSGDRENPGATAPASADSKAAKADPDSREVSLSETAAAKVEGVAAGTVSKSGAVRFLWDVERLSQSQIAKVLDTRDQMVRDILVDSRDKLARAVDNEVPPAETDDIYS